MYSGTLPGCNEISFIFKEDFNPLYRIIFQCEDECIDERKLIIMVANVNMKAYISRANL